MSTSHSSVKTSRIATLKNSTLCPFCLNKFYTTDVLWIAEHSDLIGDPLLGPHQQQRFRPVRFTTDCKAIDARGFYCHDFACPNCHLRIPRTALEAFPFTFSVIGSPASGKSSFLVSMTWRLRQVMASSFLLNFSDADGVINRNLNECEDQQFVGTSDHEFVALRKTELQGSLYETVNFAEQEVSYLRPFIFSLRPLERHPNYSQASQISLSASCYDNAGEHFLPGSDTTRNPVTRHLAISDAVMFVFDPTQDIRFRRACGDVSPDPQFKSHRSLFRQETILIEAINRIHKHSENNTLRERYATPLIVLVAKYDSWCFLLNRGRLPEPWSMPSTDDPAHFDCEFVEQVSREVRELCLRYCPEIVYKAEEFAQNVIFVPVSAYGQTPQWDESTGKLGVRSSEIDPMWVEVPLLYVLARYRRGYIRKAPSNGNPHGGRR